MTTTQNLKARREMDARSEYRIRRASQTRQAVAAHVASDGERAAAWVAQVVDNTGSGPTWRELAAELGWPEKPWHLHEAIIRGLRHQGWLDYTDQPRSLRPGPAAGGTTSG